MPAATSRAAPKWKEFRTGWAVLAAATLGCAFGLSSLPFYSLGTFIGPLHAAFGWSRGDVASSFLYSTLILAVSAPILGSLIDRVGGKVVALVAIPCVSAVLFSLSLSTGSLTIFHGIYALAALVGGGTTPVNYSRAVNATFDKARGMALGVSLAGMGLVAIILPPLLSLIIESHGWRAGFQALAILALLPWPIVLFGMPKEARVAARPSAAVAGAGRSQALRSGVFWTIGLCFAAVAVAVSALVVHMMPLLRDAGLTPMKAASTTSIIGIGVLFGRVVTGLVIDRFFAPYVAATLFVATALGCVLFVTAGVAMAPVAAVLIGLSLGAEVDLIAYLTARYFGMAFYGFVYAIIYALFAIGASIGPAIAGAIFDATGNYVAVLWGVVCLLVAAAAGLTTLPRFEVFAARNGVPEPALQSIPTL